MHFGPWCWNRKMNAKNVKFCQTLRKNALKLLQKIEKSMNNSNFWTVTVYKRIEPKNRPIEENRRNNFQNEVWPRIFRVSMFDSSEISKIIAQLSSIGQILFRCESKRVGDPKIETNLCNKKMKVRSARTRKRDLELQHRLQKLAKSLMCGCRGLRSLLCLLQRV